MKLDGQTAIIVGSGRGIGEAVARLFAREGAHTVLVERQQMKAEVEAVARDINETGGGASSIIADCTIAAQVNAMVDETVRRRGRIDILINSAGFRGPLVPVHEITEADYDAVLAVNLKAVFLCCKAVLKVMIEQKSGSIVTISGTAGKEGMALRGALCAAKWGVLGLTQTIAKEAGPHGVRANVICPGGMDEPDLRVMYAERAKGLGMTFSELERSVLELTPLRKYARHEEVAKAALFLASSDSSHTTGESLNVSGGRIMD
ncbi:MAG TPA: SDR family NAD(P)-dependent oxidoreductase [Candidatus Eisenbacteria bacterium]|nr:SDR family NAD(P)-dependent oxidoreductase [Candidatus Eisenbacteria bacterium]